MRAVLILACLAVLGAIAGDVALGGLDAPFFRGAPGIEALTAARVRDAIGRTAGEVSVMADGLAVVLEGRADSVPERDRILAAAAATPLVRRVTGRIEAPPESAPEIAAVATGGSAPESTPETAPEIAAAATGASAPAAGIGVAAGAPAFTAMKTPDGAVIVGGAAPDPATRDALVAAAGAISAAPVGGTVEVTGELTAGGAPEGWAALVGRGLEALGKTAEGLLEVKGTAGKLTGTVAGAAEQDAIAALLPPGWQAELTVAAGPPPAEVTLAYDAEGRFAAAGLLPSGMSAGRFAELLPGVGTDGLGQAEAAGAGGWERAVESLSIVLPRFRTATARLAEGRLTLDGQLLRGFSADGTRATLLAALPRDWTLALDVVETAPLAEAILTKQGGALVLSGLVPAGLAPPEAIALAGPGAVGEGLAGGGAGRAADWSRALTVLGEVAALFETARARIDEGRVELTGVLRPGYAAEAVAGLLDADLPAGWRTVLDATETPAGEGDRRVGLETGEPQVFRRGFWLPELDFPVSPDRCATEADKALTAGPVEFVTGSAEIDGAGRALIDRLAAIAVRCLNSSAMRLEIAGHTDSVGNDAGNQTLSEARARAVFAALVERGVREDALSATGYGESRPVASNDTPEGRARNRRIAFNWSGA